jgi:CheY-like chemotaxis protein
MPPALRVLVVDDDPALGATLWELLTEEGHQVEVARDGVAAIATLERTSIDLILCDVVMPVLDGLGVYEELERRWPALLSRFVWMHGTMPAETRIAAFVESTSAPVLPKPFGPPQVIAIVRKWGRR